MAGKEFPIYRYEYSTATRSYLIPWIIETTYNKGGRQIVYERKVYETHTVGSWRMPSPSTGYDGWWYPLMPFFPFQKGNNFGSAAFTVDAWLVNFLNINRYTMIHGGTFDQKFNDAFGNAFRHAMIGALYPTLTMISGFGLALEAVETPFGSGFYTDWQTDVGSNLKGVDYALENIWEFDMTAFLGGLAEKIWRELRGVKYP